MKSLVFAALIIDAIFSTQAFADPLDGINRKSSICFAQDYSASHLAKHPAQTVQSLAISLSQQPDPADPTIYLNMEIVVKNQTFSAFLICDRSEGGLACAVECDGGRAEILSMDSSHDQVWLVNKGFLMSGGCGAQEEPKVWLEPTANGDDVFQLQALPKERCK